MSARYVDLPGWAKLLFSYTKSRAKKKGIEFSIEHDVFASLVSDRCHITGIPFDTEAPTGEHYRRAFAPSIDRIKNTEGYTNSNIRVICVAANLAMNEWGEDVLYRLSAAMCHKHGNTVKWRTAVGGLPDGVKFSAMTRLGPTYTARVRVGDTRKYLGTFKSVDLAVAAIAEVEKTIRPPIVPEKNQPNFTNKKALVNQGLTRARFGRRDWTRTNKSGTGG